MLGDILEAVDAPLPAEANGRVWGRIVDELGTAVAGAEVVIWLETQGRTDYPNRENFNSDGDFLAADAIFRARQWKTWSRLRRKARTDSEGAFEFGGIAGTRCSLQLPEGLQRAGRNNSTISWSVSVGEFNLIQVTRVFAVRLTLSAPELAANTQCIVNCEPEDPLLDSVSSHASSGRELKLLLPRGRWSITPYCHVPRLYGAAVSVEVGPGDAPQVTLTLDTNGAVLVNVVFSSATPTDWSAATFRVLGSESDAEIFRNRSGQVKNLAWGRDGHSFSWKPDCAGDFVIVVFTGSRFLVSQCVTFSGASNRVDVAVNEPAEVPTLVVNFAQPGGERYSQGQLVVRGNNGEEVQFEQWHRQDGAALLWFDDVSTLPATCDLEAQRQEIGVAHCKFRPGIDREITLTFSQPAELRVILLGRPVLTHEFDLTLDDGSASARQLVEGLQGDSSRARAKVDCAQRQPGKYQLTVFLQGRQEIAILQKDVELVSGAQVLVLELPPLHSLTIDATTLDGLRCSYLRSVNLGTKFEFGLPYDKKPVLEMLPAGDYVIAYTPPGAETPRSIQVRLPAAGPVVLTP